MTDAWQKDENVQPFINGVRDALPLVREQEAAMLAVIRHALPQGIQTFLDVGCGAGALTHVLLSAYPNAIGTLMDYSDPMLAVARQRLDADRHAILNQDLNAPDWHHNIPADRMPVDVIVSGYAIHHLSNPRKQALYADFFNLLKPGGVFVNIEHIAVPDTWLESLFWEQFIDGIHAQEQGKTNPRPRADIAHEIYTDEVDDGDILAPLEDQLQWLREIGFVHVDAYMKIYGLAVFGGIKPPV